MTMIMMTIYRFNSLLNRGFSITALVLTWLGIHFLIVGNASLWTGFAR